MSSQRGDHVPGFALGHRRDPEGHILQDLDEDAPEPEHDHMSQPFHGLGSHDDLAPFGQLLLDQKPGPGVGKPGGHLLSVFTQGTAIANIEHDPAAIGFMDDGLGIDLQSHRVPNLACSREAFRNAPGRFAARDRNAVRSQQSVSLIGG